MVETNNKTKSFLKRPCLISAIVILVLGGIGVVRAGTAMAWLTSHPHALDDIRLFQGSFLAAAAAGLLFLILFRLQYTRINVSQKALRESEERLRILVKNSSDSLVILNADGSQRYVSPAAERITGFPAAELEGRSLETIIHPEDMPGIQSAWEETVAHPEKTVTVQYRHIHKTKGWVFSEAIAQSFLHVPAINGVIASVRDVSERRRNEDALRQSEARYRTLVELAVDGILLGSAEGIIIEANEQACAMFDLDRSQLVGRPAGNLPLSWDQGQPAPFSFDLLNQGLTLRSECVCRHDDGTWVALELRTKMMPDGLYQSMVRDVTERQRMEQSLRESEQKFAITFAASPDAVNINRLEDGLYVEINNGFTELTGYTREDVRGKTAHAIDIWDDLADRQRLVEDLRAKGYCENLEAQFRCKDGRMKTGLMSGRVIQLHGEPHILSITRDITPRKQNEAKLERLRVAIEQAGEVIVITDAEGAIQYANPAFERVTGYTVEEAIDQNPRLLKSGVQEASFYQNLWATISQGQTWTGRIVNRHKNGLLFTEEATISPVFDNHGAIVNFVAVKRDITAHLKLESQFIQAQKMESVGRLTGGVAHDFNNMLAIILGYADLAIGQTDPAHKAYPCLERISEAAAKSADIVRQLLAFARKQTITPQVIRLNSTVEGMLKMLRRLIGEDIELIWRPSLDLAPILIDPAQLDQILANLCVNARDAIRDTGTILIETRMISVSGQQREDNPECQPGSYVQLAICDNGCGMDHAVLANIFEPFFTTKEPGIGTGLGLATVYGIVKQNGGFIEVVSEPGQGTVFKINLPAQRAEAAILAEEGVRPTRSNHGETILLVEDDPVILDMCALMLKQLGYRVLAAKNPSVALQTASEHAGEIALLLTDVIMPEMNGRQLSQQLLTLYPRMQVLFISGYTADAIAHHGVLEEGLHFLQKPFSRTDLSWAVKEVLAGARQE